MSATPDWYAADKAYQLHAAACGTCQAAGANPAALPHGGAAVGHIPIRGHAPAFHLDQAQGRKEAMTKESAHVLDPCCGVRMMWFNKADPLAIFGDKRNETIVVTDRSHREDGTRTMLITPDKLMDFRALPFPDGRFKLVAFDPPHLERAGPRSWLAAKYGKLGKDWRDDLRKGFSECFRVLEPGGVLVFKWNETQVKLSEVLALTPEAPLFGQKTGRGLKTHWLVFMKPMGQEGGAA